MTLRELRLWHWRECVSNRNEENARRQMGHTDSMKKAMFLANFHLSAVQALNDCFPDPSDTAERDASL